MIQTCSFLNRLASKRGCGYVSIGSIRRLSSSSVSSNERVVAVQDSNEIKQTEEQKLSRRDYRFIFPEFLPDPNPAFRNPLAEKLQRQDLLSRRHVLEIPGKWYNKRKDFKIIVINVQSFMLEATWLLLSQILVVHIQINYLGIVFITGMDFTKACSRFVGICIDRGGCSLRSWFILRNIVEGQGVEFMYHMYSPTIAKIEVLRLEKRLDDELYYLRCHF